MRRSYPSSPRRGGRGAVLVALVVAATLVGGGRPAWACSCEPPAPPETAEAEADAVFAGEVTEIGGRGGATHVARLAVTEVFTGEVGEEAEVLTPQDSAACGYPFEVGREELVYAVVDDEGRMQTNLCDRTAPVADADEDLAVLGEGTAPGSVDRGDTSPPWLVPLVAAVLLLTAAAVAARWSQRRARRDRP